MNREEILKKLHSSFKDETNIKCVAYDGGVANGGWMELIFNNLNCEQMEKISYFLRKYFSQPNLFSHNLPKLIPFGEGISLIFQDKEVERVYGNV
jgi:hypothetical protein